MLSAAAQSNGISVNPTAFLAGFLQLFRSTKPAHPITHGTARYVKRGADLVLEHSELSFQPGRNEDPEAFMYRVAMEAGEQDVVEFRMRDGKISQGVITRPAAQPLRMYDDETLAGFVSRVKDAKRHGIPSA